MRLSGVKVACLMAALMPLSSGSAQVIGQPGGRQRAVPDLVSLILYIPPITLGSGPPPPPGPQGGREAEGSVILSGSAPAGGAVITLSSGNTALLHVPATVTVPAGANTVKFRYDPLPVAEPTTVTASAVYSGQTKTASVLILPPRLQALTLDSLQIQGGNGSKGWVKFDGVGPTDKDIRVALSSNHPAVQMPAEVLLRGVSQKEFQLTTKGVGQLTTVLVSASLAGRTRQASFTVAPAALYAFGSPPEGGSGSVWRDYTHCYPQGPLARIRLAAKLTGPAPFDGNGTIKVTSSNPQLLPVPAKLGFAPNAIQAETELTCPSLTAESIVNITGTYLGVTRSYVVTIKLVTYHDLTVSAVLYDGMSSNVVTRPTNPLPFRLCAVVASDPAAGTDFDYFNTRVRYAYQHSRGFSRQVEQPVSSSTSPSTSQVCMVIEGLEIGEYVDVTLRVDPTNASTESNETNNILKLRVTR